MDDSKASKLSYSTPTPPYSPMEKNFNFQFKETEISKSSSSLLFNFKRHCARFWWVYLGFFGLFILVIILFIIYVIVPNMIQQNVNESYLLCSDMRLENPTPSSITLSQKVLLSTKTRFSPKLEPFEASLYLMTDGTMSKEPMSKLLFPKVKTTPPVTTINLQDVHLDFKSETAIDEVIKFSSHIMNRGQVTTAIVGSGKVQLGFLPAVKVKYNQTISFRGLDGLKGFDVSNIHLNLTTKIGEPDLTGLATVPNPSILTIEMGDVTFGVFTASAGLVGSSTIRNMVLKPGTNRFLMTSSVDQAKIAQSMDKSTGMVNLLIRGDSAVYGGQRIPFYEKALASSQISLPLNITAILAKNGQEDAGEGVKTNKPQQGATQQGA